MKRILVLVACVGLLPSIGLGQDSSAEPTEKPQAAAATAEQIAEWIKGLSSDEFKTRKEATEKLIAVGTAAIKPVAEAADSDDLELPTRCVNILKTLYESKIPETKAAAETALKGLAKSERRFLARRATEALKKPVVPPTRKTRLGNIRIQFGAVPAVRPVIQREIKAEEDGKKIHIKEVLGREIVIKITEKIDGKEKTTETKVKNIVELMRNHAELYKLYRKHMRGQAARPQIVVNGQAIGGQVGNAQIRVSIVNGQREIEAEEGGRKVKITDTQGMDIVVRVTKTENGKEETKEYKAKDYDELKKKHPEIAKIYKSYTDQMGNNNIQVFAGGRRIRIGGAQPQALRPARPIINNAADRKQLEQQLESIQQQLQTAIEKLKKLATDGEIKPEQLRKLAEEIEAARGKLAAVKKKVSR